MTVYSGVLIACDCTGTILVDCGDVIERFNAPIAAFELGLRWLHDRCYTPLFSLLGQRHSTYWDGRLDGAVDSYYRSLPDAIELGLRWLHDRCEEDNQSNFVDVIKNTFPSIMTGIAHGLVLESQQRLTDELKGDRTTMRKLHKRARELTKRRKKRIP